MVNVLIASNNIYYAKALMDLLNSKNTKVTNLAISGIEALGILKVKKNIDIIILESELSDFNAIKIISEIKKFNIPKYKKSFILISNNKDLLTNEFIFDIVEEKDNLCTIKSKVEQLVINKMKNQRRNDARRNIISEVKYLGYNLSYRGTQYLIKIIEILLLNQEKNLTNLEKEIYPILANIYKTSVFNIKSNIIKSTEQMYIDCENKKLRQYFGFLNDYKPTTKTVIYTIYNNILEKGGEKSEKKDNICN